MERRGFDQIVAGDREGAIKSFLDADRKYPGLHNVRELSKTLQSSPGNALVDPSLRQQTLTKVVTEFSWHAPPQAMLRLRQEIKRPNGGP